MKIQNPPRLAYCVQPVTNHPDNEKSSITGANTLEGAEYLRQCAEAATGQRWAVVAAYRYTTEQLTPLFLFDIPRRM